MTLAKARASQRPGTRYLRELEKLPKSYALARTWDVSELVRVLERAALKPLMVAGSGGSFSVASYCAGLHRCATGRLARAVTPLTLSSLGSGEDCGLLCVSASGGNVDILAGFEHGARLELRPAIAFALEQETPLHALADRYDYPDRIAGPKPAEPDGFLAVNSVLVTCLVFARAYRALSGRADEFPSTYADFLDATLCGTSPVEIASAISAPGAHKTLSILYSPEIEAAAVDLESRFVEAALGNVHAADLRNFGHGRHNWMDKRGETTAVLSLSSRRYASLAERTLKVLPAGIPIVRAEFDGPEDGAGLAGLVTALHVAQAAGVALGVDPGRPGIPEFGRKLFRLPPPKSTLGASVIMHRKVAAIRRAGGVVDVKSLEAACATSRTRIERADIEAVVLDYDGTLCDMRRRFLPLAPEVGAALLRVTELGLPIGIATGRGQSVAKALREALPKDVWSRVWIGFYNGSECTLLSDATAPHDRKPSELTGAIAAALHSRESDWQIEPRARQVTVTPKGNADINALIAEISAMLAGVGREIRLVTSSHSVDILLPGVSKRNLVARLCQQAKIPEDSVLRIGDRGVAPGNDFDLLRHPLGLSADEVSPDPESCWRWSAPGILGPKATLGYLNALERTSKGVHMTLSGMAGRMNERS